MKKTINEYDKLLYSVKKGNISLNDAFQVLENIPVNNKQTSTREQFIIQQVRNEFKTTFKVYQKLIKIEKIKPKLVQ